MSKMNEKQMSEVEYLRKMLKETPIHNSHNRGMINEKPERNVVECAFCGFGVYLTKRTIRHTNITCNPKVNYFCNSVCKSGWIKQLIDKNGD